jgi:ABC-type glycerol-3-phosphate transport system substrate-binding protein
VQRELDPLGRERGFGFGLRFRLGFLEQPASGCKSGATPITFWAWVPGISRAVTAFNQSHPGICVTLDDVGAGAPE